MSRRNGDGCVRSASSEGRRPIGGPLSRSGAHCCRPSSPACLLLRVFEQFTPNAATASVPSIRWENRPPSDFPSQCTAATTPSAKMGSAVQATPLEFGSSGKRKATTAKLKHLGENRDLIGLLSFVGEHHTDFNAINVAAAVSELKRQCIGQASMTAVQAAIEQLEQHLLRHQAEYWPRQLASVAHGFAKLRVGSAEAFEVIAGESVAKVDEFSAQSISMMLWAFAKAGQQAPALFDQLGKEAIRKLDDFNPQNLANTAWAFATARHAAPELLFTKLSDQATRKLRDFNEQNLVNTAWAFAVLAPSEPPHALLLEATRRALEDPGLFTIQGISNLLSARAVCGCLEMADLVKLSGYVATDKQNVRPEDYRSLYQCHLSLCRSLPAYRRALPPSIHVDAKREWMHGVSEINESSTQLQVLSTLESMRLPCKGECATSDGLFSVDVMVDFRGRQIAVEVNGPSHYTSNHPYTELGFTSLRRRLLEERVGIVVSVPFFEWYELRSPDARQAYMQTKLQACCTMGMQAALVRVEPDGKATVL